MACGNVQSMRWQCVSLATGKCSGNDGAEACTIGTAMRSGIERGRRGGGDQLEGEMEHMMKGKKMEGF